MPSTATALSACDWCHLPLATQRHPARLAAFPNAIVVHGPSLTSTCRPPPKRHPPRPTHAGLGLQVGAPVQQQLNSVRVTTSCCLGQRREAILRGDVRSTTTALTQCQRRHLLLAAQRKPESHDTAPSPSWPALFPARSVLQQPKWRHNNIRMVASVSMLSAASGGRAHSLGAHDRSVFPVHRRARVEQPAGLGGVPGRRRLPERACH